MYRIYLLITRPYRRWLTVLNASLVFFHKTDIPFSREQEFYENTNG